MFDKLRYYFNFVCEDLLFANKMTVRNTLKKCE